MQRRLQGMRPDYLIQQREIAQKKLADATSYDQRLRLIGISPMNTCFISIKGGLSNLIFLIPLCAVILAIFQLIHDLFLMYMFNSDKGVRRIYKKNSWKIRGLQQHFLFFENNGKLGFDFRY